MGNTCTPVADPCQCMAKPLQYCKVISLQLKKKKKKQVTKLAYFLRGNSYTRAGTAGSKVVKATLEAACHP